MQNVEQTIISQYGNSATITALIYNMNDAIDPAADLDNFYSFVWNVETAVGFGLDIWGRIVNVSRYLQIPETANYFGFNEAGASAYPFNEYPFYSGIPPVTNTYALSDDAYRQLILTKALSNISATTSPAINQLLQNFFAGYGRCYVNDMGKMGMRYTFEFLLTPLQLAIITQSGALPRPAGVSVYMLNTLSPTFGFSEGGGSPFGEGTFIQQNAISAVS